MCSTRRTVAALAMAALVAAPLACSDDETTSSPPDDSVEDVTTSTTVAMETAADDGGDLAAFCDAFPDLGGDAQDRALTAEQWEDRITLVEGIAAVAPDEIEAQAEAYIAMNEARAELAAENGYVAANDLPADAREAFIAENLELQQQVNQLIAYMQQQCG